MSFSLLPRRSNADRKENARPYSSFNHPTPARAQLPEPASLTRRAMEKRAPREPRTPPAVVPPHACASLGAFPLRLMLGWAWLLTGLGIEM